MSSMSTQGPRDPSYDSELYASNHRLQRERNLGALNLLQKAFAPMPTEDQQFLDLGCGTGDFTRDCLLPMCPPIRRLVAVDASEEMLSYARRNFAHPSIEYDHLNIGEDVSKFVAKYGQFARVYSFFCLNWVKDQEKALKNVSRLLTPSGECLLIFPAWSPSRMLYRKMAGLDRWKKFSNIFEKFVPRSQDLEDDDARWSYLLDLLNGAGFNSRTCELLCDERRSDNTELKRLIDTQLSLNPAESLMTAEEKEHFRKDVAEEVINWSKENAFDATPSLYLVHARKVQPKFSFGGGMMVVT